ncbi:MAG: hypothetical protein ACOYK8_04950 [Alphaproteobacteria bacterium]
MKYILFLSFFLATFFVSNNKAVANNRFETGDVSLAVSINAPVTGVVEGSSNESVIAIGSVITPASTQMGNISLNVEVNAPVYTKVTGSGNRQLIAIGSIVGGSW